MGEFTLFSTTQIPHIARVTLGGTCNIPESKLRVIAPDVGGGFGSKLNVYAEEALALVLARRLARPVKWIEERTENYLSTIHGRGVIHDVELAATKEGKILGIRVKQLADMGAYFQLLTPGIPELGAWVYMGPYDMQGYWYEFTGIMTNATPTDAYRGAGRPEATFVLERAVDSLARKLGKDPAEVRRISLVPKFDEARPAISGLSVDSGDYEAAFSRALEMVGYDDLRKEQQRRREQGEVRQLGIGLSTYIEMCGLAPSNILGALRYAAGGWDACVVQCLPDGKVVLKIGTSPHGQGHVTTWAQIAADALGVTPDDIEVMHGDTMVAPLGMDTYGSRSVSVGATALHFALEKIKDKARTLAAHELEVAEDDLDFEGGTFRVKGAPDKARTIIDLAVSAWHAHNLPAGFEPNLETTAVWDPPNFTWPGGTHVCVVEVDTETGATRDHAVHRRGRLRRRDQPHDRRGPGPRRRGAGHRRGAVRGGRLRRPGQPDDQLDDPVPDPGSVRAPVVRAGPRRDALDDQPARCEGDRRGRHDRLAARGGERGDRCDQPSRRDPHREAGVARARVESHPRGEGRPRMIPAPFEYQRVEFVDHAIQVLTDNPDAKILAGGHSLLPLMRLRLARPSLLVDISRLQVSGTSGRRATRWRSAP